MQDQRQSSAVVLETIKRRNRLRFGSVLLVLLAHAGFVGGIMFYRDWFALPIGDSGVTVGIAAAIGAIVFFLLMEAIYIMRIAKLEEPIEHSTNSKEV